MRVLDPRIDHRTCTRSGLSDASVNEHRNLPCQERRDGIPDLDVLLRPIAEEQIVVGEGLKAGGFADSQAAALPRIRMDEVVSVLGDVAGNGCRGFLRQLNPESVIEHTAVPVLVVRAEGKREVRGLWAVAAFGTKRCREQVSTKIRWHVPPGFVLGECTKLRALQPAYQRVIGCTVANWQG